MSWIRVMAEVGVDASREDALELAERMLDVADVPGFIFGSGGITFHDDKCADPECRGCGSTGKDEAA